MVERLTNLRYADDTAIIADGPESLQLLLNQLPNLWNIKSPRTKQLQTWFAFVTNN